MAKTLEEYLKENPNLSISQADMDLGRQNFGALEEIIKARQDWANATTKEEKDAKTQPGGDHPKVLRKLQRRHGRHERAVQPHIREAKQCGERGQYTGDF